MPYCEDDMIPISALTHYAHCPRRCALTHIENLWQDNIFTVQGNLLHEKTDSGLSETRRDRKLVRSLRLSSLQYGISGIADVVEFQRVQSGGITLPRNSGCWLPFPVEFKRGAAHDISSYKIQLCAQAFCLEEMLHIQIGEGAVYSGVQHQRVPVVFDDDLRNSTARICIDAHILLASGNTPPPIPCKHCSTCSMIEYCSPVSCRISAKIWLEDQLHEVLQ